MSYRGGIAKLYYESTTTWGRADAINIPASPTWVEITRAIDVTFNLTSGESDGNSRESIWEADAGGLLNASVDFSYRVKQGADTIFDALWDSFVNDSGLYVAVMDQDIATVGSKGMAGVFRVTSSTTNQPLTDGASADMTLTLFPAFDANNQRIDPARLETTA
jgi:hypothetical protein